MIGNNGRPIVTVLMANYNGDRFIEAALQSALQQTLHAIEVLVIDDGSTDGSVALIAAAAERDNRIRLIASSANRGPGAARNLGLAAARGRWIAVADSDDLMHPERLERLVTAAEADQADIVADDLLLFDDAQRRPPETLLRGAVALAPTDISLNRFIHANALHRGRAVLGYLKPIIRSAFLARSGVRYDPRLRIAEDYDLLARLLLAGARFRLYPELTYFYRKHESSVSHRLTRHSLEPMLSADNAFRACLGAREPGVRAALDARRATLLRALAFDDLVSAVKQQDWREAVRLAFRNPRAALLLREPLLVRIRRLFARLSSPAAVAEEQATARVCLISRQRIAGSANGSSAYLLSLCRALRDAGHPVHLVSPSPGTFGRWPVLRLAPEMEVFRSIAMRGAWRLGRTLIAKDPRIAWHALLAVVDVWLRRAGLGLRPLSRAAPYVIAAPWTREDAVFVACHARPHADIILADYVFLANAIPYALRPDALSAIIMHDLFSQRLAQFGGADAVVSIEEAEELALLAKADAVIAIQQDEAGIIRRNLPGRRVILAPMAVAPAAAPQPGGGTRLLFVGSNTAPNVSGLRWFVREVWPQIRAARPEASLQVAGTVARALDLPPRGISLLGRVSDLAPLYRDAAIVISPLLVGSGLKIKLIEALGHGKAVVATSVTLQGVADIVRGAVSVADTPDAFAAAILDLLSFEARRLRQCEAALAVAREAFSELSCYTDVIAFANPNLPCSGRMQLVRTARLESEPSASLVNAPRSPQPVSL